MGSGALLAQAVTWASRSERPDGRTSPEELIAAAHCTCFAMALSLVLGRRGVQPEELRVDATCSLELEGAPRIAAMDLRALGVIPGLNRDAFSDAITAAADLCPISNALRNNVRITVAGDLAYETSARRA